MSARACNAEAWPGNRVGGSALAPAHPAEREAQERWRRLRRVVRDPVLLAVRDVPQGDDAARTTAERIEAILRLGDGSFELDAADENGWTALHHAAFNGDRNGSTRLTRLLLAAGAEPRRRTQRGTTALINASIRGNPEVVQALLRAGSDVEVVGANGANALHLSAYAGSASCVRLLVDEGGASLGARTRTGRTALHCASTKGHVAVARVLLRRALAGANLDITAADGEGRSARDVAVFWQHREIVLLIEEAMANRGLGLICRQRLAWAQVGHARLGGQTWERAQRLCVAHELPWDLLELVGQEVQARQLPEEAARRLTLRDADERSTRGVLSQAKERAELAADAELGRPPRETAAEGPGRSWRGHQHAAGLADESLAAQIAALNNLPPSSGY